MNPNHKPGASYVWIIPPTLICVLWAVLAILVAYQMLSPVHISIRPYDRLFLRGVYPIEQIDGEAARWTTGFSEVRLPYPSANQPAIVQLTILNGRPAGQPEPRLSLINDSAILGELRVPQSLTGRAITYRLLLPPAPEPVLRLGLAVDTIEPPDDPRQLGVVLRGASISATQIGLNLPSLSIFLLTALGALGGYATARGFNLRARRAVIVVVLLVGLFAAGVASNPAAVIPFTPQLAGLVGLGAGAIWLARWFMPQGAQSGLSGLDLALCMGFCWWAMPLFQHLLTIFGAPNVAPNPITNQIGLVVAGGLLIAVALRLVARASGNSQQRLLAQRIAVIVLLIGSLAHTAFIIWFAFQRSGPDFWIHFRAVRGFARDGLPLYDLGGILANHFGFSYKWPPFYAALLRPFALLDGTLVLFGQRVLNSILLGISVLLLVRQARSWSTALLLVLLLNFRPAADTIAYGQVDILMLLGFTLALLATMRGKDAWAGAIIAVLALIKIYPVLLFGFFLVQRRWRAFGGAVIAGLACTAVSLAAFGWETHWFYLSRVVGVLGSGGGGTAWVENQTINGWLSRMVAPQFVAEPFSHPLVQLGTYGFFAALLALASLAARPGSGPLALADGRIDWASPVPLQYCLFVFLMLIAVPAAWMHYHTAAIICFAVLILRGEALGWSLGQGLTLAAAYALVAYGNHLSFADSAIAEGLGVLGYSYKLYGLLLLAGLTLRHSAIIQVVRSLRGESHVDRPVNPIWGESTSQARH
jgi:alpha-1,2-mannosyltransferase